MSRELKLGALGIVLTAIMIWGYQFMRGKNLFKGVNTYYTIVDNVDGLTVSAPVKVNGYKIGLVNGIELNPQDVKSMKVTMEVTDKISFPKSTVAHIESGQIVGGKEIALKFDQICQSDCLQSGSQIKAVNLGFLESLLGQEDLDNYSTGIKETVGTILDTLNRSLTDENIDSPINNSVQSFEKTMKNFESLTNNLERLVRRSQEDLNETIGNMATISHGIAQNSGQITSMLNNMDQITMQLKEANLAATVSKTNEAIDQAAHMLTDVSGTLELANTTFTNMNEIMTKLENGDGSFSKLINDKTLYENLSSTSQNLSLLLQDMRLNPKRYVNVSVFGKKSKPYTKPEDDPAYNKEPK